MVGLLWPSFSSAQWVVFSEVPLAKETELKRGPEDTSETVGLLPAGSIVKIREQKKPHFIFIEIELETGMAEGWIRMQALEQKPLVFPAPKLIVPKDEAILIRRDPSFQFGFHLGANLSFIGSDVSDLLYVGPGFIGGGYVSMFLNPKFLLRFEAGYSLVQGSSDDNLNLSFGFFDLCILPTYLLDSFEIFGGLQYSIGLSVVDIPTGIVVESPTDLSSIWGVIGAGYRMRVGSTSVLVRLRYGTAFQRNPFVFHVFGLTTSIEFNG